MVKYYRYFFNFLRMQENWLNKMARKGRRLVGTDLLSYRFEPCGPGEYEYRIEFVAQMSYSDSQNYRDFLKGLGYDVFYKNSNLNLAFGKIRWRPYGRGMGQIATNPGAINRELLIVGKKRDGKPFELHSTNADKADYCKNLRNAWLSIGVLFLALFAWKKVSEPMSAAAVVGIVVGILCLIPVFLYQRQIRQYEKEAEIQEK